MRYIVSNCPPANSSPLRIDVAVPFYSILKSALFLADDRRRRVHAGTEAAAGVSHNPIDQVIPPRLPGKGMVGTLDQLDCGETTTAEPSATHRAPLLSNSNPGSSREKKKSMVRPAARSD